MNLIERTILWIYYLLPTDTRIYIYSLSRYSPFDFSACRKTRTVLTERQYATVASVFSVGTAVLMMLVMLVMGRTILTRLTEEAHIPIYVIIALALASGLIMLLMMFSMFRLMIRFEVYRHRQRLNAELPYANSYIYTLAKSGYTVTRIIDEVARADDIFPTVAREFTIIQNNMEFLGDDLIASLEMSAEETPSSPLRRMLIKTSEIIDSQRRLATWLKDVNDELGIKPDEAFDDIIESVDLLTEMYLTFMIGGSSLLVVGAVFLGIIGVENATLYLQFITYGLIPLGGMAFVGISFLLTGSTASFSKELSQTNKFGYSVSSHDTDELDDAFTFKDKLGVWYIKATETLPKQLRLVPQLVRTRPQIFVAICLSITIFTYTYAIIFNILSFSYEFFASNPVIGTITHMFPALILFIIPASLIYEAEGTYVKSAENAFVDFLSALATEMETQESMLDAIDSVQDTTPSVINPRLAELVNTARWVGNLEYALIEFANTMRVAAVSRQVKVLNEVDKVGTDKAQLIENISDDMQKFVQFQRRRVRTTSTSVFIIVFSFLIYLGIIAMVDIFFLQRVAGQIQSIGGILPNQPFSDSQISITEYRMLLYHSALLQTLLNGLVIGRIRYDRSMRGFKYTTLLTLITTVVFVVIQYNLLP